MAMSPTEMQFVSDLTRAGFDVVGGYFGDIENYVAAAQCTRLGFPVAVVLIHRGRWAAQLAELSATATLTASDPVELTKLVDAETGRSAQVGMPMAQVSLQAEPLETRLRAELSGAGFGIVGAYRGPIKSYALSVVCERGGYTVHVVVTHARNGFAWSANIEGITESALGDNAAELAEHVDSLIATYSPESRLDFAQDSIRTLVARRPMRRPVTEEDTKAVEDALGLLERVFGEA